MNATDLIRRVCEAEGVDPTRAAAIMRAFLEAATDALVAGDHVTIRGFGRFETHVRRETVRRNPKTGSEVVVPEHQVVVFKAAPNVRGRINE